MCERHNGLLKGTAGGQVTPENLLCHAFRPEGLGSSKDRESQTVSGSRWRLRQRKHALTERSGILSLSSGLILNRRSVSTTRAAVSFYDSTHRLDKFGKVAWLPHNLSRPQCQGSFGCFDRPCEDNDRRLNYAQRFHERIAIDSGNVQIQHY